MTVIDVHTHMLTLDYLELLRANGTGKYTLRKTRAGQDAVHLYDAPFMTLFPGMWDYELRIRKMDEAKVDVAIVSLTCPNAYWGGRAVALKAAQIVNDSMAEQQRARPDRIRWFASLPFQYADDARAELARCVQLGAVGVMVIANIDGDDLTDPKFAPVWAEIDKLKLPVLVHPGAPQGVREQHMDEFNMIPPVGFMCDTTLAFTRMIYSGFLDKYPDIKLIASHGGATLPYLAGRLDRCWEMIPGCAEVIKDKPSAYLQRIWYDTVVYDQRALELCISVAGSPDRVLYGSDYPHNIGDMIGCLARVNALPADQAKRIAGKNAEALFGL
ncbi:amidohydrolase family protein [Pseudorhodoplanes sp.]|uniref:amidohydrolase family protein n=1 Tax=Pseudorhodoplanes sp. TaxID=1934341 RepID=UPI00391974E8